MYNVQNDDRKALHMQSKTKQKEKGTKTTAVFF